MNSSGVQQYRVSVNRPRSQSTVGPRLRMVALLARMARGCTARRFSTGPALQKPLQVDFYFDTVSPYSWPAFEVLCRYRARWDLSITWKPVYLAGLTKAAGNRHLDNMASCPSKVGLLPLLRVQESL